MCLDADGVCDMAAFAALIGSEPKFNTPARHCQVVTDEIKGLIRKCIEENSLLRATGMRKLLWTCRSIHTMLLEKSFTLSYPSVCNHVSRISATMGRRIWNCISVGSMIPIWSVNLTWARYRSSSVADARMAVFTLLRSNRRRA